MRIAVAGATGVLGQHIASVARARGHDLVPLARSLGIDLMTRTGLSAALDGVEAVIDAVSIKTQRASVAEHFFSTTTSALLAAEQAAGVHHHVAVSIVGVDDVPLGYYRGKVLQEHLIAEGSVPWTILRATQFHEFAEQALGFMRLGPVSLVPRMPAQTIAAEDVAAALVDVSESGPAQWAPDLAGPEENEIVDLARRLVNARRERRRIIPVRPPGAAGRAIAVGALRPQSDGPRGSITFEDWLSSPR